jgi:hypothetical protein
LVQVVLVVAVLLKEQTELIRVFLLQALERIQLLGQLAAAAAVVENFMEMLAVLEVVAVVVRVHMSVEQQLLDKEILEAMVLVHP